MTTSPSRWRRVVSRTLDLLLPPSCLSCDRPVGENRALCPNCWSGMHFIARPFCACCGAPFDFQVEDGTLCGGCIAEKPHFSAARAVLLYNDNSKHLVLRFKHGDRTDTSRALAAWMYRAGEEFRKQTDVILPVPLHRSRLFERRYNQAALLAQSLAQLIGKPYLPDTLVRHRSTVSQGHMSRKERHTNVRNAFRMASAQKTAFLEGKNALLVDDVLTTGATVNECSRLLLDSGAKSVNVLVLARVRGYL